MRKFVNWASILFIVLLAYAFVANYFDKVPYFPFGEFDIFPTLGIIVSAIAAKDFLNSRKYINLIKNGEIKNLPSVMSALEKYDTHIYKIIMEDYYNEISDKIDELNAYIEDEKYIFLENIRKNSNTSFDIKKEVNELHILKCNKDILKEIKKGVITWDDVHTQYVHNVCIQYVEKFLLEEVTEDDKEKILRDVKTIETLRNGDANVILK